MRGNKWVQVVVPFSTPLTQRLVTDFLLWVARLVPGKVLVQEGSISVPSLWDALRCPGTLADPEGWDQNFWDQWGRGGQRQNGARSLDSNQDPVPAPLVPALLGLAGS